VTGPVNKTLPSQTVYPQPEGKLCEVKSAHAPFAQGFKAIIILEAGRFGDGGSGLSLVWEYMKQEGSSVLTTLKDITPK
jgi:hypothetical protein